MEESHQLFHICRRQKCCLGSVLYNGKGKGKAVPLQAGQAQRVPGS